MRKGKKGDRPMRDIGAVPDAELTAQPNIQYDRREPGLLRLPSNLNFVPGTPSRPSWLTGSGGDVRWH